MKTFLIVALIIFWTALEAPAGLNEVLGIYAPNQVVPLSETLRNEIETEEAVAVQFQGAFICKGPIGLKLNGVQVFAQNTNAYTCSDGIYHEVSLTQIGATRLVPFQTYSLVVTGASFYDVKIEMEAQSPHDLLDAFGRNSKQHKRFDLWFKGSTNRWLRLCDAYFPGWNAEADNNGNCGTAVTFQVQLRPNFGARNYVRAGMQPAGIEDQAEERWDRDEDAIAASSAPGDAGNLTIAAARSGTPSEMTIQWEVLTGRKWDGAAAGKIRYVQVGLSTNSYRASSLFYTSRSYNTNEVDALSDTNGVLRQVVTPQALINIETLATNSFQLRFYLRQHAGTRDTNGFFTLNPANATNFVVWRFDSPDGSLGKLRLNEVRNGKTNTSIVEYDGAAAMWKLSEGTGIDARTQTRKVTISTNAAVVRLEEIETKNSEGTVLEKAAERFEKFAWGYELTASTNDPGGANLVTQYFFNTDTNGSARFSHKKLAMVLYPDGFWEKRQYWQDTNSVWTPPGALWRIVHPWKDTETNAAIDDCWVTQFSYPFETPGSFNMAKWHDAADWGNNFDDSEQAIGGFLSTTYEEGTYFEEDDCANDLILVEHRRLGNLIQYAEDIITKTFGPGDERRMGRVYSKGDDSGRLDSYEYRFGEWNASTLQFTVGGHQRDVCQISYHGSSSSIEPSQTLITGEAQDIDPIEMRHHIDTKVRKIISGGNLVARETYVFATDQFRMIERKIYQRDSLGHVTNVFVIDPKNTNVTRVLFSADWTGASSFPGDLKLSETDEFGITHTFAYNSLKQLLSKTKAGVTNVNYPSQSSTTETLSYAGPRIASTFTTAGSLTQAVHFAYDRAGRLTNQVDIDGLATSTSYELGGRKTVVRYSSGATQTNLSYLDRRLASVVGTATTNRFLDYSLSGEHTADYLNSKNVTTTLWGASTSTRWTASLTDHREKFSEWRKPGFWGGTHFEKLHYVISSIVDSVSGSGVPAMGGEDTVLTDYEYDGRGELIAESLDGPDGGNAPWWYPDVVSTDRVKTHRTYFSTNLSGHWFAVRETLAYPIDDDSTPTLLSRTKERLSGFASSNEVSEVFLYDAHTNETVIKVTVDFANKLKTTTTIVPESVMSASEVSLNGLVQTETTTTVSAPVRYFYDALGREVGVRDSLGFQSGTRFDANTSQVVALTNKSGQVTSISYYLPGQPNAGLPYREIGPTGLKTYFAYNIRGQLTHVWGDARYPETRGYNEFGEKVTLTTYRGGYSWGATNWAGVTTGMGDTTTFSYHEPTGLLVGRTDAAGQTVSYSYYDNHLPMATVWARGAGIFREYSHNLDLVKISYTNDWGQAPVEVEYQNHNRFGLPRTIRDAAGEHTLAYDYAGRLASEAYTNGLLNGVVLSHGYDRVHGMNRVQLRSGATTVTNTYGFDSYGRINGVTNGAYSVVYSYLANSDLLETTTSRSGATPVLTATRKWENGYRLRSIRNVVNSAVVSSHDYLYDALDRRTHAYLEDGSVWLYGYNNRSELTRGARFWSDWTPVAGQQFEYAYDNIGNRTATREGGDANGGNLRSDAYGANSLNQITVRTNSGFTDIIGAAYADATVRVNGTMASNRKGEYFHHALPGGNNSTPAWQVATNAATLGATSETNAGALLLAPKNQQFAYDLDGNLTSDGVWSYTWDGKNRLQTAETLSTVPPGGRSKAEFAYDHQNRMIGQKTYNWTTGWNLTNNTLFVYDGWNLIAELNATNKALVRSYLWGLDLSGSLDEAGGIGGLVLMRDHSSGGHHFYGCDGNGNVTVLVKAADQTVSAKYDYDPFLDPIRVTGAMARVNPFLGSTKRSIAQIGLLYYGERFYSPTLGNWLNQDPIGEEGGLNLYAFVNNNAINGVDPFGTFTLIETTLIDTKDFATKTLEIKRGESLIARVRTVIDQSNNLQQFLSGVMEAQDTDISDLVQSIQAAKGALFQNLRGASSGQKAVAMLDDMHHIFPQAKSFAKFFKANRIEVDGALSRINGYIHRYGVHEPGGGPYNEVWDRFVKKHQRMKKNPYYVLGFGVGLFERIDKLLL